MSRTQKSLFEKYIPGAALLLAAALLFAGCGRSGPGAADTSVVNLGRYYEHGGMAAAPDGSKLYVTNYVHNTILVLEPVTLRILAEIPVNCLPRRLVINPAGTKMFVGHDQTTCHMSPLGNIYTNNTQVMSVIDLTSNTVTNEINLTTPDAGLAGPREMIWDTTRDKVVAAFHDSSTYNVGIFDTATGALSAKVNLSGAAPVGLAMTSDGATLLVPRPAENSISVINPITNTQYGNSPWATSSTPFSVPAYITISHDNKVAFITDNGAGNIAVVDITNPANGWFSARLLGTIPVGNKPGVIALTTDNNWLLVACNGVLFSIPWSDLQTGVGSVFALVFNIGASPSDIAIIGDYAYVSDLAASDIYIIKYKDPGSSMGVMSIDAAPFAGDFPRP